MSTPSFKSLEAVADREEEGVWVDIKHPNGELFCMGGQTEKHLRIKVAGSHSGTYREMVRKLRDQTLKRGASFDAESIEKRELGLLAAITLEWEACFDDAGNAVKLTAPNARALYEAASWIADQVNRASDDHASFFPVSSPEQ